QNGSRPLGQRGIAPRCIVTSPDRICRLEVQRQSHMPLEFPFESDLLLITPSLAKSIGCCLLRDILRRSNTSKTEVICAGVDLPFPASANDVPRTILFIEKKRPAAMPPFFLIRLSRIKR